MIRPIRATLLTLAAVVCLCCACTEEDQGFGRHACDVSSPAPYPARIPYLGIHANPGNNDFVSCTVAQDFEPAWHVLQGHAVAQPNTFSPDGQVTYLTTSNPEPDGCRLYALRVSDGEMLWCQSYPLDVMGSSVEVDENGRLFFSAGTRVYSLGASGEERWSTKIPQPADPEKSDGALGLHFTPEGHIATVTNLGKVLLLDRETGDLLASLDIPDATGFVPPPDVPLNIDLEALLPQPVLDNIASVFGTGTGEIGLNQALSIFLGSGGSYSNNTIGVSPAGDLYVVGGGLDPDSGALVQIRVGGPADAPVLEAGWALHTVGGSATSPSISPDGRFVSVGDGTSPLPMFAPSDLIGHLYLADIQACDQNADDDPDPKRCAPAHTVELSGRGIAGSPPLLDGPVLYFWDMPQGPAAASWLRSTQGDQLLWEKELEEDRIWTAVMTVTQDHILGTTSRTEPSDEQLLQFTFPKNSDDQLVLLDRHSGQTVFSHPLTDDSAATVTIGPRGSLYVGMLGLVSMMCTEEPPVLGLAKFSPK